MTSRGRSGEAKMVRLGREEEEKRENYTLTINRQAKVSSPQKLLL